MTSSSTSRSPAPSFSRLQKSFVKTNLAFRSMMVFRRAGELGFAEIAVKRMVESKSQVSVESLPPSLSKLFKLVILRPIYNQDDLRGMIVLRNLSLVFTIIDGKKAQDEKNRLNRERDIASEVEELDGMQGRSP